MKAHMASTLAIAMAATIGFVSPARSQVVDTTLWVTNGFVYAAARSGTTLFIGGDFTAVGPATAGGVPLTTTDGSPMAPFPKVAGAVLAIAPDGSGGWYIGGSFNAVGGLPRAGLAHVRADRTVAPWNPNVSGGANTYRVEAIALSGNTVYIGGDFSTMGGLQRKNLAALNGTTAAVTSWNPGTDSTVHALAVSGQVVYVGGEFDLISGQSRSRIAALDATTAAATAWDPNATSSGVDNYVAALVVSGNLVYAAGNYQGIGGQVRRSLAALDATTGLATAWNPGASVTYQVMSLAVSGSVVYASGNFATIGGQSRSNLAALDATTGLFLSSIIPLP